MSRIKYIEKDAYTELHRTMCIDWYEWNNISTTEWIEEHAKNAFNKVG